MAFVLCKLESDFHKNLTEFHQISPKNLQNLTLSTANGMYETDLFTFLHYIEQHTK